MTISLRQTHNLFALLVKLHLKCMLIVFKYYSTLAASEKRIDMTAKCNLIAAA